MDPYGDFYDSTPINFTPQEEEPGVSIIGGASCCRWHFDYIVDNENPSVSGGFINGSDAWTPFLSEISVSKETGSRSGSRSSTTSRRASSPSSPRWGSAGRRTDPRSHERERPCGERRGPRPQSSARAARSVQREFGSGLDTSDTDRAIGPEHLATPARFFHHRALALGRRGRSPSPTPANTSQQGRDNLEPRR